MADIANLIHIAGELQTKASNFTNAAETLRQQATRLNWASQGLTNGSWAGQGSQSFQNAWNLYHRDTNKAADALDSTAQTLTTLAGRLNEQVQALYHAQELAAIGLPAAAAVATAAAEVAIFGADFEIGWILDGISGGLQPSNELMSLLENPGTQSFIEALNPTEEYTSEKGKGELGYNVSGSVWSRDSEQNLGNIDGAPVSNTFSIEAGNGKVGFGVQPGKNGATDVALEGELSLLNISDNARLGTTNLGLTGGSETEALGLDGDVGWHDNSLGASVGATWISETGSVGADIGGVNVGVNGTIGLKAEFGIEIGEETKIKLPFISFGFSIGKAL
ncbi:MAG TPA: WXG100 family type VII secretion target [Ktedonobacteraceae bacterium]|nr:WXG100 family type VII secretion target [Ktedonobacteraceae bacterium]